MCRLRIAPKIIVNVTAKMPSRQGDGSAKDFEGLNGIVVNRKQSTIEIAVWIDVDSPDWACG